MGEWLVPLRRVLSVVNGTSGGRLGVRSALDTGPQVPNPVVGPRGHKICSETRKQPSQP